jgi:hypothetical protein
MLYLSNVDSKPVTRAEVSEPHPIPPALNSQ